MTLFTDQVRITGGLNGGVHDAVIQHFPLETGNIAPDKILIP